MTDQKFNEKDIPFIDYITSGDAQKATDGVNLGFLLEKGQDVYSVAGLKKALVWIKRARTLDLFHGSGEGTPDEMEVMIGEMRRTMLISSVTREIARKKAESGKQA